MSNADSGADMANAAKQAKRKAEDLKDEALGAIDPRLEFEAQIETLREELAKVKAQLASSGERSAAAARKAASSGAEHIKAQGEAAMEDFRAGALDMEEQVADAVRRKPITSLAIAAGMGFVFALIARR